MTHTIGLIILLAKDLTQQLTLAKQKQLHKIHLNTVPQEGTKHVIPLGIELMTLCLQGKGANHTMKPQR